MSVAAPAIQRRLPRKTVRLWLQVTFWVIIAVILLVLMGVQFGQAATISILAVTITKATPITLGALAGICSERTGVVNIGIEGLMLTAAFMGFMVGVYTHNLAIA
ncbi:MAG TPA: ABC transporter permease, partial [Chloroflexota bacterium]|nr:ABC transporter permease [Chloroflexota bacterium]